MHRCLKPLRASQARRSERGATFLEVLISFSLILLLVLFVVELFPSALIRQRLVEGRQIGLTLADQELQAALCAPSTRLQAGWSERYEVRREGRVLLVISQAKPDNDSRLVHIAVKVSWVDRSLNRSVTREAYLATHPT